MQQTNVKLPRLRFRLLVIFRNYAGVGGELVSAVAGVALSRFADNALGKRLAMNVEMLRSGANLKQEKGRFLGSPEQRGATQGKGKSCA